jgi:hypothetical protein
MKRVIIFLFLPNGWSDGCKAGTRLAKAGTGMVFGLRDRFSPPLKSRGQTDARSVMMGAQAETREYKTATFQFTIMHSVPLHPFYELDEDLELGIH